ncbi:MAG TPA: hypothetical protein DCE33_10430 [Rhodospirillaceae bacterium]|nr:hypothetical protein [Rhodospirillaceae bacterium]
MPSHISAPTDDDNAAVTKARTGVKAPEQNIQPNGFETGDMEFNAEMEKRLQKAEQAVEALKPDFLETLASDLEMMDKWLGQLAENPGDENALFELRALLHDLKGNAGSFDFPLVSAIAGCLSDLIQSLDSIDTKMLAAMRDHRNSIEVAGNPQLANKARQDLEEFIQLSRKLTASL